MYYYKEVMAKKLKERDEIINSNIRFYHNKLGNSKGYKLYDIEYGDLAYEPIIKQKNIPSEKKELERVKSTKNKSYKAKHVRKNTNKKQKKKGIIAAVTALILAGVMTVSGFLIASKLKKKDNGPTNSTSTSQKTDDLWTGSLDSLGEQLPTEKKGSEYTKVSGDISIEDIVRGADGVLYDSEESANNASKVGTSEIDTKGGSLVVSDNGKVYTKDEGYEVVDEDGNVIESGNGTPNFEESGIDCLECPCYFYDDFGNEIHYPGELITSQELEKSKQKLHTTKPQGDEYAVVEEEIIYYDDYTASVGSSDTEKKNAEEIKIEEETKGEEVTEEVTETTESYSGNGVVNSDGTYTIYGVTYASYADYQQYIFNNGEGYGYIDGIIQPIGEYEIEYQYIK